MVISLWLGTIMVLNGFSVLLVCRLACIFWESLKELYQFASRASVWTLTKRASICNSIRKCMSLKCILCKTENLHINIIKEIYAYLKENIDCEDSNFENVRNLIQSYSYVMLCRGGMEGPLKGIMFLGITRKGTHTVIRIGLVIFKKDVRGGPYHYLVPGYLMIRELIKHPRTPVHVVSKLYSYKPYMVGAKFKNTYPRYDCKTPKEVKTIIDEFAASVKRPTERYNPETNVISSPKNYSNLRQGLVTVNQGDLKNTHIKFYVDRNPGWAKGDTLLVSCHFDWKTLIQGLLIGAKKSIFGSTKVV